MQKRKFVSEKVDGFLMVGKSGQAEIYQDCTVCFDEDALILTLEVN